jgi:hypothetical protein
MLCAQRIFCGPRKLNIILTQLRNSASFLNFDLFRVGIVSDPSCRCGAALENLKHFFLDCPIYIQARTILIGNIKIKQTKWIRHKLNRLMKSSPNYNMLQ